MAKQTKPTGSRGRPPRSERDFAAIRAGGEDSGDLNRRILGAAAEIFAERGFAAASIDEVAQRLGATKGLVYHRYRSKGELLADVCRAGFSTLEDKAARTTQTSERAVTRLTALAVIHASDVLSANALHRTMADAIAGPAMMQLPAAERDAIATLVERRRAYDARFAELIAEAGRERDLPSGRDTEMLGRIFVAVLDGPLRWPQETLDALIQKRDLIARQLAYFALRGAGASDTTLAEEFSR